MGRGTVPARLASVAYAGCGTDDDRWPSARLPGLHGGRFRADEFRDLSFELFSLGFQSRNLGRDRFGEIGSDLIKKAGLTVAALIEIVVGAFTQVVQGFELVDDLGVQCVEKFARSSAISLASPRSSARPTLP